MKGEDPSAALPAYADFCRYPLRSAASLLLRVAFVSLGLCRSNCRRRATFLAMTFFHPPKVEIREIVREVPVRPVPAIEEKATPETKLAADRRFRLRNPLRRSYS